jgi:hypothetical protein
LTLTESIAITRVEPGFTDRIASELARVGGEVVDVGTDQVLFKGDRRAGSWRLLGGIGDAAVHRTAAGLNLVATFPRIVPFACGIAALMVIALIAEPRAWSILVLMATLLPLFISLVLRGQMRSLAALIRRAAGA